MPGPESSTCNTVAVLSAGTLMRTVTQPPPGVYCKALSTRLRTISRTSTGCPISSACSGPSKPRSMRFSMARGTKSRTVSRVICARSMGSTRSTCSWLSARAMANSWFTMCAARWLDNAICCKECFMACGSASPPSRSRPASSACMRRPASGVFNWCAASARKWRCADKD